MEPRSAITSRDGVGSLGQMPRGVGVRVQASPGCGEPFPVSVWGRVCLGDHTVLGWE